MLSTARSEVKESKSDFTLGFLVLDSSSAPVSGFEALALRQKRLETEILESENNVDVGFNVCQIECRE